MKLNCGCEYHDISEQQTRACCVQHAGVYVGVIRDIERLNLQIEARTAERDRYKAALEDIVIQDVGNRYPVCIRELARKALKA